MAKRKAKKPRISQHWRSYAHMVLENGVRGAEENSKGSKAKESVDFYLVPLGGDETTISHELDECFKSAPKSIKDLNDGLTFETFEFSQEDSEKLKLMGFAGVDFSKTTKVIVVEYAQVGTHICGSKRLKFGIGARMMMNIKRNRRGAKLDTPYQVAASVIFGKASVRFSLKTFGIVGPGIHKLITSGQLAEDTYTRFINDIASIIEKAYKGDSEYKTTPQPMFLQ